jgi:hypothetical protein
VALNFSHLVALTDERGIFEHAKYKTPRIEHGYCVDDVSRALIVIERNQPSEPEVLSARDVYIQFLREAQTPKGTFINRCDTQGNWHGVADTNDHWGRALWSLGTAYRQNEDSDLAMEMLERFELSAKLRSPHLRSMLFASLGAAEVLSVSPTNVVAQKMLIDTVHMIETLDQKALGASDSDNDEWMWPEARLTYANAILPEVILHAGNYLYDTQLLQRGIDMLNWLLKIETSKSHFSVTPTGGRTRQGQINIFDQQSIEVAALVDACSTAYAFTRDPQWLAYIARGAHWFEGANDAYLMMYDPYTGAGFDGLTAKGTNKNCGAESTICYLSVSDQYERHFGALA